MTYGVYRMPHLQRQPDFYFLIDARTLGKRPSDVGMYLYNFICCLMQYDTMKMELLTDESAAMELDRYIDMGHLSKRYIVKCATPVRGHLFWQNKINEVIFQSDAGSFHDDHGTVRAMWNRENASPHGRGDLQFPGYEDAGGTVLSGGKGASVLYFLYHYRMPVRRGYFSASQSGRAEGTDLLRCGKDSGMYLAGKIRRMRETLLGEKTDDLLSRLS